MVIALLAGFGLRVRKERSRELAVIYSAATEPTRPPSRPDPRETALKEAFQTPYNPKAPDASRRHLEAAIQLGEFLSEPAAAGRCGGIFSGIAQNDPAGPDQNVCHALGKVGQALVLAFQDRAKESNELLLEIQKDRPAGERPRPRLMRQHPEYYLLHHPQLRPLVDEALDHNAANIQPAPLPEALEKLRRAPVMVPRGKQ